MLPVFASLPLFFHPGQQHYQHTAENHESYTAAGPYNGPHQVTYCSICVN